MPEFNKMQIVKRHFFAMRNGVVADTLRRGGSPYRIIFGLNLPQITDFAKQLGHDRDLALLLWDNATTRESRLLAPMLLEPSDLAAADLDSMLASIADTETADVFCLKFLRRHPDALAIARRLAASAEPMQRYIALRLMMNILRQHPSEALALAQAELAAPSPQTLPLATRLADEAAFLLEE